MAQKVVDQIVKKEKQFGKCKTDAVLLCGTQEKGEAAYDSIRIRLKKYESKFNSEKQLIKLLHTYGEACFNMLEKADDISNLTYAEIDYCIENEGLEYLSDYYF